MQDEPPVNRNLDGSGAFSNPRICICDNKKISTDCSGCRPHYGQACANHKTKSGCGKLFHVGCLASHLHTTIESIRAQGHECMKCDCTPPFDGGGGGGGGEHQGDQGHDLDDTAAIQKEMLCLGIDCPPSANEYQRREANRQRKKLQNTLTSDACAIPQSDIDAILSNEPRPYPTPVKMCEESMKRHVLSGRRFDISMLMYEVDKCPTVMEYYKQHHNNQTPWEFLQCNQSQPNATICKKCYDEIGLSGAPADGKISIFAPFLCMFCCYYIQFDFCNSLFII